MTKRKQLINVMSIILAAGGLTACGGGGGDSTEEPTLSSKTTTVGTLTGFGSVYVNGVKFETDGASYDVDDDDTNSDQTDLAVGMKVKIEGSINDDGVTGTADSVYYDDDVEGPIDSGSLVAGTDITTFTVLGMTVQASATSTVFDDGTSFDTLTEGDIVEVSGYFDGTQIVASRIEKQDDADDEFELKGTVDSYNGTELVLTLQNGVQSPAYPVSAGVESDIAAGTSGQFVEAKLADNGGTLEVIEIELDDDDLLDGDEDEVELYGILSGNDIDGYLVNEVPLSFLDTTVYEPLSLEGNLAEGMQVEVEGNMVDGTLMVKKIEAESEDEVEIEALLSDVTYSDNTNGTLTLFINDNTALTVTSNNSTLLEDDSSSDSADDGTFTLDELVSGTDFVEVEAYFGSDSELVAIKIKRKDESSETTVEAPIDDFVSGTSITLLGVTYTFDATTTFQLDDGVPVTDSSEFFTNLILGDTVKIKDDEPDGVADEVSRDTSSSDD